MPARLLLTALVTLTTALSAAGAPPVDPAKAFHRAAAYSRSCEGQVLLVMKDGQVVFQDFAPGWNADRPHPLASGTKSFTGVAAMLAVQQGLLSLDEKASDTLTEWKSDPRRSRITVRQLLDLSSGLEPDSREDRQRIRAIAAPGGGARRLQAFLSRSEDFFGQGVAAPAENEPGARFEYGSNHFFAFGALLERRLQQRGVKPDTVWEWYQANLLDPIGMTVASIGRDLKRQPQIAGGASASAREWARFGEFVRLGGACVQPDGTRRQVLRSELLDECFRPSAANPRYGLTWWLGPLQSAKLPPVRVAAGLGKQRLYVIPSAGLVAVRFAPLNSERTNFDDQVMIDLLTDAVGAPSLEFESIRTGMAGRMADDVWKELGVDPPLEPGSKVPAPGPGDADAPQDGKPEATGDRQEPGMRLVLDQGFDVDGPPDPAIWGHETGFVRNQEAQWYRPENAVCQGGLLVIQATRERVPNPGFKAESGDWRTDRAFADYASASVTTKGKWSYRHGRVRMRARLDVGPGLWPAFWSVGSARPWPANGEIDIMENYRGLMLANAAWGGDKPGKAKWKDSKTPLEQLAKEAGFADVAAWSKAFHEWQFDWTPQRMEFRLDGRLLNTVDLSTTVNQTPDHANPFHEPQSFIVNLAVGGTSGGDPSATPFPARLEVDWIRVWQTPEDAAHDGH